MLAHKKRRFRTLRRSSRRLGTRFVTTLAVLAAVGVASQTALDWWRGEDGIAAGIVSAHGRLLSGGTTNCPESTAMVLPYLALIL